MTRSHVVRASQRFGPFFWFTVAIAVLLLLVTLVRHAVAAPVPSQAPPCDTIDFNQDGLFPDTQDVEDFRAVLAGGASSTGAANDIDFNNDGVFPDTADLEAFLRVFAGGPCEAARRPQWRLFVPPPSSRQVFVSSSLGSDANDGTILRPRRTIAQGFALLGHRTGDSLFLRRGDVFQEHVGMPNGGGWNKSGLSADAPLWLGAYGDASLPRPIVHGVGGAAALNFQSGGGVRHVVVDGVAFVWTPGSPAKGINWYAEGTDVLLQDCEVRGFVVNLNIEALGSSRPVGAGGGVGVGLDRLVIRGCSILDANPHGSGSHSNGVHVNNAAGVMEWCLLDNNGRDDRGFGTTKNHNLYLACNVPEFIVRDTISTRGSATGLQLRAQNTSAEGCLVAWNPLGLTTGHAEIEGKRDPGPDGRFDTPDDVVYWPNMWPAWGSRGHIVGNLIVGGGDIAPNLPRGMSLGIGYPDGLVVRDNIVLEVEGGDPAAVTFGGLHTTWTFEGNTVYAPAGALFKDDGRTSPRPPLGDNTLFDGGTPPVAFADFLRSIGCSSREDYLAKARHAWSRHTWEDRYTPGAAIAFIRSRLAAHP